MQISDEAVVAAANAISEFSGRRNDGHWLRVEDLGPEDRKNALMEARAAIEAAAPIVAAEVLREIRERTGAELEDAPYPNGEEDDYASGYAHGVNFVDVLLRELTPKD